MALVYASMTSRNIACGSGAVEEQLIFQRHFPSMYQFLECSVCYHSDESGEHTYSQLFGLSISACR